MYSLPKGGNVMYTMKGFVNIQALANNEPENVSDLGELSNKSMTYAIEKGYYQYSKAQGMELVAFTSRRDDGPTIKAPVKYTEHTLTLAKWIFDQSVAGKLSNDADAFQTLFMAQFGALVKNFETGKMITARGQWMPAYISWSLDDPSETNKLRIWFNDGAFRSQYDDYQIVVITPIDPVDTFQKVRVDVEKAMASFNVPDHHKKVETVTKGEPYTYLVSKDYPWYDREDPKSTLMTTWSVAIYGAAGNNLEIIKDAIADHILENSDFDREDWVPVFPDIFTSTEFMIIPFWHRRSVPDATPRASLYSPFVPYDGLPALLSKFIKYQPAAHVTKNLFTAGIQYKSLAAAFVGGPENRDKKFKITDFFPDYALLDTKSIDFNRMEKDTVEWVIKLVEATITAEQMDEYSFIGQQYARVHRDGLMYIAFSHGDVSYIILSRLSMERALGINNG